MSKEHDQDGAATTDNSAAAKPKHKLPIWLTMAIRKPRVWKTWTRCMIATFATLVLMLAQPSLNVLGQAAFFGLIMSQIIPPFMAVGLFLIAMTTLMVGIAMGWAWGAAAMAAGLQARSQVLLNEQVQREQAGYNAQYNVEQQYQASIFRGAFLDPRSSAVYGVFLFFGAYFFGFVRAKKPRMMLFAIFGTIILDLMCSFGPLFPIAQYTLAKTLLTPAACYIAIALATSVLIFPQSLNHIFLTSVIERPLAQCLSLLKLQDRVLATTDPADWEKLAAESRAGRMEFTKSLGEIEGQVKLLHLEVTRGRTSAADLGRVFEKLKELGGRMYGLTTFVLLLDGRAKLDQRYGGDGSQGVYRMKRRNQDFGNGDTEGTDYASLFSALESSTAEVRHAAAEALQESIDVLYTLNHSRWFGAPKGATPISVRESHVDRLRTALEEFKTEGQFRLLDNYKDLFDSHTGEPKRSIPALTHAARNLFRCQVFTTTLAGFGFVLVEWLELLLEIERANPKPAFQFPGGTAKAAVAAANDKEGGGNPLGMGVSNDDASSTSTLVEGNERGDMKKHKERRAYAKDPDAGDPTNAFQKLGRKVHATWRGVSSPEGIFALKYALVSIALWVPQVAPASAQFVYENRGLWALIMAQTGLGVFTGEQVFSFLSRMIGTVIGLVVGMVVWYIGAARGPGNPYGIAAASMVFLAPFLFLRVNSPPQLQGFFVMIPVTIVFVVGYSWVDSHIYQTANQGVGAGLAGRRALLVIIGFTAGFLIMVFPKPVSAKTRARLSLARIISELGDLYGSEIGGFELEIESGSGSAGVNGDKPEVKAARQERYRGQFLKIFGRYEATVPQLGFAKFEPGTRGPWPEKQYQRLVGCIGQTINALALLSGAYGRMDRTWARRLAEHADTLHPSFIADTLALFALLHSSLKHAHPLPPTIPLFERLYYHQESKHALRSSANSSHPPSKPRPRRPSRAPAPNPIAESNEVEAEQEEDHEASQEVEMVQALGSAFNFQTLHDEQFALYATANVALLHLTNALNEMHLTVKELVGEKGIEGFNTALERWADLERG